MHCRFLFIPMLFFVLGPLSADEPGVVKIIYTASLNGNLDGCGCLTHPRAGLVKSAAYIREIHNRKNTILIDAGDLIYFDNTGYALQIAEVYSELGFDLACAGEEDFSSGLDTFSGMSAKIRFYSGNLALVKELAGDAKIGRGPLVKSLGGRRIGIVPLIDPDMKDLIADETQKKSIEIRDPVAEAKSELDLLVLMKVDCSIIVFHGTRLRLESLLTRAPGFDIAILAHGQELIEGTIVGGTLLVSPGEEGNRVGVITMSFDRNAKPKLSNAFRYFSSQSDPDDPPIRHRLDAYYEALKDNAINGGSK